MIKGFVQIPILISIFVSALVFGGGGYLVAKNVVQSSVPQPEQTSTAQAVMLSDSIATTTEKQDASTAALIEGEKPAQRAPAAVTRAVQQLAPQPVDVCLNIEGVQNEVPSGYSKLGGECSPIKDVCPNIDGVQSNVPNGMLLMKTLGCITEDELDAVTAATNKQSQALENCVAAKARLVDISRQREAALAEHNAILAKINTNSTGAFGGALGDFIRQENERYFVVDQALILKLGTAKTEVNLFCM